MKILDQGTFFMQDKFHVLTFHSFKGGSGKTTLSINFAYYFAQLGYKTLLIENDLQMPTYMEIFQKYWTKSSPSNFLNSLLLNPGKKSLKDLIYPTSLSFDVICTDPSFDPQQIYSFVDQKIYRNWLVTFQRTKSILQKEGEYNFIILDCPPGWHFLVINNLIITDTAVIVSRINKYEVLGVKRMLEEIYFKTRQWKNNLRLVWNQVPRVEEQAVQDLLTSFNQILQQPKNKDLKTLGIIPSSDQYSFETAKGEMLLQNSQCESTKKAIKNLVDQFISELGS